MGQFVINRHSHFVVGIDVLLGHKFITQEDCHCAFVSLEDSSILASPIQLVTHSRGLYQGPAGRRMGLDTPFMVIYSTAK